jgi:carboxypeptidase D
VTATSEEEIAQDFIGFFKNFQDIFGISNHKIYVTGESYAGRYVPYVSAAMVDQNDTKHFDISGALMYDPCIGNCGFIAQTVPTVPYVEKYNEFFKFNSSFMSTIKAAQDNCGYTEWIDTYLKYPPPGPQPEAPVMYNESDPGCNLWNIVQNAALQNNPCFNPYEISDTCPILFDPLSFPTVLAYNYPDFDGPFFNRADVKKALHVSGNIDWAECTSTPVFVDNNDNSLDPIQEVLPKVIEHTNRVLVANGDYDYEIINDGTLLAIQNMTWNGELGFQKKPSQEIIIELPDLQWGPVFADNGLAGVDGPGQGTMGVQHYERGISLSSHKHLPC